MNIDITKVFSSGVALLGKFVYARDIEPYKTDICEKQFKKFNFILHFSMIILYFELKQKIKTISPNIFMVLRTGFLK